MLRLVIGRTAGAALTLLAISVTVFIGTSLLPGDVAETLLGQASTPEAAAALRASMHLTDPAPLRYLHWLAGLLRGDLGISLVNSLPVAQMIGPRLANSLLLAALTAVIAVPAALLLGIAAAVWRGSALDRVASATASIAAISHSGFPGRDRRSDPVCGRAALVPSTIATARVTGRLASLLQRLYAAGRGDPVPGRHRAAFADDAGGTRRRTLDSSAMSRWPG